MTITAFEEVVEFLCDGNPLRAFELCERIGGARIVIPTKMHKRYFAESFLKIGHHPDAVAEALDMQKQTVRKIKERVENEQKEE